MSEHLPASQTIYGLENIRIECPYCWEHSAIIVDTSVEQQQYIEDCEVCCRPILLLIQIDENARVSVQARHENE